MDVEGVEQDAESVTQAPANDAGKDSDPARAQAWALVQEVESGQGRFALPTADEILMYGALDEANQQALVGQAAGQAAQDAEHGVLLTHGGESHGLEVLLEQVPGRMDDVAGARGKMIGALRDAQEVLKEAREDLTESLNGSSFQTDLREAHFQAEVAAARLHNLEKVTKPSGVALVVAAIAAITGLAVDGFFLGDAIEKQDLAGLGTSASTIAGFIVALFLSAAAWFSGVQLGKSVLDKDLAESTLNDTYGEFKDQHSQKASQDARESRRHMIIGLVLAAIAVIPFVLLGWERLQLAAEDGTVLVTAAIILFAFLGLAIFFVEGFMLQRWQAKKDAIEDERKATARIDELQELRQVPGRLQAAETLLANYTEETQAAGERPHCALDWDIADALKAVVPLSDDLLKTYKHAAIDFLEHKGDPRLSEQIDDFQMLSPPSPRYTPRVERYLALAGANHSGQNGTTP